MTATFPEPEEYAGPPFELIDRPEQIVLANRATDGLTDAVSTVARRLQGRSSVIAVKHDRRAGQAAFVAGLTVALRSVDVRVIPVGGLVNAVTIQRLMGDAAGIDVPGILPPDQLVRALRDTAWLTNIVLIFGDAETLPTSIYQYLALLFKLFQFQPLTLSIALIGDVEDWPGFEESTLGPDWQAGLTLDAIYYVGGGTAKTGLGASENRGPARLRRPDFAMDGPAARAVQAAAAVLAVVSLGYVLAWPNDHSEPAAQRMAVANLALPPLLSLHEAEDQPFAGVFDPVLLEASPSPPALPEPTPLVGPVTLAGPDALAAVDMLPVTPPELEGTAPPALIETLPTMVPDTAPTANPQPEAELDPVARRQPPAISGHGGPGLVLMAGTGDDLASLYAKIYRGVTPPPFSAVKAANPLPVRPGILVVFPAPPGGWPQPPALARTPAAPRSSNEFRVPS